MEDSEISDNMLLTNSVDADGSSSIKVRSNFPETWLWDNVEAG
jgi:hypothetical protein